MIIFTAPVIVLLVALGVSARIVALKGSGREVSKSLGAARYALWSATGFSLALAIIQSGMLDRLMSAPSATFVG